MQQSTSHSAAPSPIHVGIIMDGNGRWATGQGRSRAAGHRAGAAMVRRIVEAAPDCGIGVLTLVRVLGRQLAAPADRGRLAHAALPRVSPATRPRAASPTASGSRSSAGATGSAPRSAARSRTRTRETAARHSAACSASRSTTPRATRSSAPRSASGRTRCRPASRSAGCSPSWTTACPVPEVDLLIRTGGEQRLSDFLLWEAAYAELLFSPLMWPEFGPEALRRPCATSPRRERRFGGLPDAAAG